MNAHEKIGPAGSSRRMWLVAVLLCLVAVAGLRLIWPGASGVPSKQAAAPASTGTTEPVAQAPVPPPAPVEPPRIETKPAEPPAPVVTPPPPPEIVTEPPPPPPAPAPKPAAPAPAPAPGDFVPIPAGTFTMGNTLAAGSDGHSNEMPPHEVAVGAFQIGRNEVTKALWDEVRTWATSHGYTDLPAGKGNGPDHPVHSITWHAAVKWCNARSEKENLTPCYTVGGKVLRTGDDPPDCAWKANGYRLPTEAEWEKAARGGLVGKRFPWGDTISHNEANFRNVGGETYQTGTTGDHPGHCAGLEPYTAPVGSFAANGFGLRDMAGNVWEWCWDWYGPYPAASLSDPRGAAKGTLRVYRGGSWRSDASECRAANRYYSYPGGSYDYVGFRLARGGFVP